MTATCIVIGASHAAAELIPSLRKEGWEGDIIAISDEPYLPYHRPPLSKTFLTDSQDLGDILIRNRELYERLNVRFMLGQLVIGIDRGEKLVVLENGSKLNYDKLALCTGSRVREIVCKGNGLEGIHYLRTVEDVDSIKVSLKNCRKAVIIGGGYIGLEMAASLKKAGVDVTVLELAQRVLERVAAPALSEFYTRIHIEEGVDIRCNTAVSHFEGLAGRVSKVICADGGFYDADLVVVGIGIVPNVELASAAGLMVDNGILVNEYGQTDDPDIVAAGDCTNHPNQLLNRRLRLESVPNAVEQAKSAAASICGKSREYSAIPWFWSDQYDVKLQIAGLNTDYDQVIMRGDSGVGRSFALFYLLDGGLIAADCVNRPREFMQVKQALTKGLEIDTSVLSDDSIQPKAFLTKQ